MTCTKVRYLSRRQARRAASRLLHVSAGLSAYRCHECGLWHLTSQSAARKARLRPLPRST